jgi:type II secretory pathway component PulK
MDRTTVIPPEQQKLVGLININTAPLLVLKTLPDLTDEQIVALIEQRKELDAETKATTAWLVTEEVIDLTAYAAIAPFITARAQQFTIESLGYADHLGMVTRLQVVVDMVGPLAQTIYYRDITQLGGRYPIREEDLEKMRVP